MHPLETDVLVALRRIVQAIDQHSNRLGKEFGLTTPQLLVLQAVAVMPEQPIRAISAEVTLSQATVTSIVDRLERRGLVERQRSGGDRRKVFLAITTQVARSWQAHQSRSKKTSSCVSTAYKTGNSIKWCSCCNESQK